MLEGIVVNANNLSRYKEIPTIAIGSPVPPPGESTFLTSDATPELVGTASDPEGLMKVEVSVNGGPFVPASGTTFWSFTTGVLNDGAYTIVSKATDNSGL